MVAFRRLFNYVIWKGGEQMKLSLKLWRLKAGYTQAEVAKILKISPATLIKWEKGETQPRIDTLMALCKLYNCAVNDVEIA